MNEHELRARIKLEVALEASLLELRGIEADLRDWHAHGNLMALVDGVGWLREWRAELRKLYGSPTEPPEVKYAAREERQT